MSSVGMPSAARGNAALAPHLVFLGQHDLRAIGPWRDVACADANTGRGSHPVWRRRTLRGGAESAAASGWRQSLLRPSLPVRPCLQCCGLRSEWRAGVSYLALRWPGRSDLLRALGLTFAFPLAWEALMYFSGQTTPASMLDSYRTARQAGLLGLLLIADCLVAPVTEEFAMRGFLFRAGRNRFWARSAPFCLHRRCGRFCTRNIVGFSWLKRSWSD